MAMIKQRRQFLPQSIGVVRPDTGAGMVASGAENLARSMIEGSFSELKRQARKKGIETAQAVSAESLRTIDPITGRPEAFKVPSNFGTEAQQAYEELIEQRYVNQTESDLKLKAQQIAMKHQYEANGSAMFAEEFGIHIDELAANSTGKFESIVKNIGANLLASNQLNMQQKELERTREGLVTDARSSFNSSLTNLTDLAQFGASDEEFELAVSKALDQLSNLQTAFPDQITSAEVRKAEQDIVAAEFKGKALRITKIGQEIGATSNDYIQILQAIKNPSSQQALNNIQDENLREQVKRLVTLPGFSTHKSTVISEIDQSRQLASAEEVDSRQRQAELEGQALEDVQAQADVIESGLGGETDEVTSTVAGFIANGSFDSALQAIQSHESKMDSRVDGFNQANRTTAPLSAAKNLARHNAQTQMVMYAENNFSHAELIDIENYVATNGNADIEMSAEARAFGDKLIEFVRPAVDGKHVRSEFNRAISNTAPVKPTANQQAAADIAAGNMVDPTSASSRNGADLLVRSAVKAGNDVGPEVYLTSSMRTSVPNNPALTVPNPTLSSMMMRGIIPDGLDVAMSSVAKGADLSEEAYANAIQMFRDFYAVPTKQGVFLNRWLSNGFDPDENAVFVTAMSLMRARPGSNAKQTIMRVIEMQQNAEQTDAQVLAVLGTQSKFGSFKTGKGALNAYVMQISGSNRMSREFVEPIVKRMALNNFSFKEIDKAVKEMHKNVFVETKGMVTDFASGASGRSAYGLDAMYPNDVAQSAFISKVQEELNKETTGGYVFSESASQGKLKIDSTKIVTLVPLPNTSIKPNQKSPLIYMPMYKDKNNELTPVLGSDGPILIPFNIANKEISEAAADAEASAIEAGAATEKQKKRRAELADGADPGPSPMPLDVPSAEGEEGRRRYPFSNLGSSD